MSANTKNSLSPALVRATTVVPLLTIAVILGLTLYSYNSSLQQCVDIVSASKNMIKEKKYQEAYGYLQSKKTTCHSDTKAGLDSVQYQRYLAVSADKTGNKTEARAAATNALRDYRELSNEEKERMGSDSFAFGDSMLSIVGTRSDGGIEGQ